MAEERAFSEPRTWKFDPSGGVPNHPSWPVVFYREAFLPQLNMADAIEQTFRSHGWVGSWRAGMYDFHHFHSNAHEVLGIASGEATVCLGGPDGETVQVRVGDVLVLPAGTGHKCESASEDFQMVGAYPVGQENHDLCRAKGEEAADVMERVRNVPAPPGDPLSGPAGPVMRFWK